MLGAASMEIGGPLLLSVTTAGVLALTSVAYYRSHSKDPGLTTEIALVLALVLGRIAVREPFQAAALAVAAAILLAARTLSTVATVAQISIVVAATSPETLLALAVPLTFAGFICGPPRTLVQTPLTSSSDLGLVSGQLIADGSQSYMYGRKSLKRFSGKHRSHRASRG